MSELHHISETLQEILSKLNRLEMVTCESTKPFLNIDEASSYLKIPKQTLYQFTSKRRIPFHKLNDRRLYFDINDLNNFILDKKNRHKSDSEIESEAITRLVLEKK